MSRTVWLWIVIGVGILLFCIVFASGNLFDRAAEETKKPVEVVRGLWQNTAQGNDVDEQEFIVTTPPPSFYDSEPRCKIKSLVADKLKASDSTELSVISGTKNDWAHEAVMKMIAEIRAKQLKINSVKLARETGDEAAVEVIYKDSTFENITVKTYFLLARIQGKWKVFLVAQNPWTFNSNYAKRDCP